MTPLARYFLERQRDASAHEALATWWAKLAEMCRERALEHSDKALDAAGECEGLAMMLARAADARRSHNMDRLEPQIWGALERRDEKLP